MKVCLVIFDFDGTFTDGRVFFHDNKVVKAYNVKDGYGIKLLREQGIKIGVISGFPENKSTRNICKHLGIPSELISLGNHDKIEKINEWKNLLNITMDQIAYFGDDLNDVVAMKTLKITGCPKDAVPECKDTCLFISDKKGGKGAVRDFCHFVINYIDKPISGLICVKENSNRCPSKNFRQFGNESLLILKIKMLLSLKFLNNVIVNTESEAIIKYISEHITNDKLKIIKRDKRYTSDDITNREFCNAVMEGTCENILYSPVTMPFITRKTYHSMYYKFCENKYDSIILAADGKQGTGHTEETHSFCFAASVISRENILRYGDFIGQTPYFQQSFKKERIDIDTIPEFETALYHYYNYDGDYGMINNPLYNFKDTKIDKIFN